MPGFKGLYARRGSKLGRPNGKEVLKLEPRTNFECHCRLIDRRRASTIANVARKLELPLTSSIFSVTKL